VKEKPCILLVQQLWLDGMYRRPRGTRMDRLHLVAQKCYIRVAGSWIGIANLFFPGSWIGIDGTIELVRTKT
jgi:hypothetical protein